MAVTRAEKEQALQDLQAAFNTADTAILVDYKGLNVPQVTELRRQLRGAKASYQVVKNTLARRASKGTKLASLEAQFEGTTAIAYTGNDAVALAKALTAFMKTAPMLKIKAAVLQGEAIQPQAVADLAVPRIADWCVVQMADEEGLPRRIAVAHQDPAKVAMAIQLQEEYPADPDAETGVAAILRHGRTEYVAASCHASARRAEPRGAPGCRDRFR